LTIVYVIQYCIFMNSKDAKLIEKLMSEHRRGSLTLVVLTLLTESHYGYALIHRMQEAGLTLSQDTVYPLLRRLEQQGLLESEWIVDESRPRKYYKTSSLGRSILGQLQSEWLEYTDIIRGIIA
jgi:PadR family transcriptional regulator, regulatory protein PadR